MVNQTIQNEKIVKKAKALLLGNDLKYSIAAFLEDMINFNDDKQPHDKVFRDKTILHVEAWLEEQQIENKIYQYQVQYIINPNGFNVDLRVIYQENPNSETVHVIVRFI